MIRVTPGMTSYRSAGVKIRRTGHRSHASATNWRFCWRGTWTIWTWITSIFPSTIPKRTTTETTRLPAPRIVCLRRTTTFAYANYSDDDVVSDASVTSSVTRRRRRGRGGSLALRLSRCIGLLTVRWYRCCNGLSACTRWFTRCCWTAGDQTKSSNANG